LYLRDCAPAKFISKELKFAMVTEEIIDLKVSWKS